MSSVSLGKSFSCSMLQFTHLSNCQLVFDSLPIMVEGEAVLQIYELTIYLSKGQIGTENVLRIKMTKDIAY